MPHLGRSNLHSWNEISKHDVTQTGIYDEIFLHARHVNGDIVAWIIRQNGENMFQTTSGSYPVPHTTHSHIASASRAATLEWHDSLGHLPHSAFVTLSKMIVDPEVLSNPSPINCKPCMLSKCTNTSLPTVQTRATAPWELIHSDLNDKFSVPSIGQSLYYVTFIDDLTQYAWVYVIGKKSDTSAIFVQFVNLVENQGNTKVKCFRTDN